MLHDICVGKTGTLTKGKMNVVKFQLGNNHEVHSNDPETVPATYFNSRQFDCSDDLKEIIKESIMANTDVRIEIDEKEFKYEPRG